MEIRQNMFMTRKTELIEKKTLYGNTTYNYDKDGNLIRITEPENRKDRI